MRVGSAGALTICRDVSCIEARAHALGDTGQLPNAVLQGSGA